jgi:hypothetical protein
VQERALDCIEIFSLAFVAMASLPLGIAESHGATMLCYVTAAQLGLLCSPTASGGH